MVGAGGGPGIAGCLMGVGSPPVGPVHPADRRRCAGEGVVGWNPGAPIAPGPAPGELVARRGVQPAVQSGSAGAGSSTNSRSLT
jgi:hypothetical protein